MKRAAITVLLLLGPQGASAADDAWRAAWHQVEMFPDVRPGTTAYDDKAACEKDLEASQDRIILCAYLEKPEGAIDAAIAMFSEIITKQPKDDVVINQRGNLYMDKGDTAHAIADYTRAMKLNPGDYWAYILRASAYERSGQRKKAIADYKAGIARHPDASTLQKAQEALKKLGATP
ncbi:MAG: tetratricopeptide repeat protein [Micropepsaceae bacterium]